MVFILRHREACELDGVRDALLIHERNGPEALAVFLPWPMMTIRAKPRNKVRTIAMPKNVAATVVPVD